MQTSQDNSNVNSVFFGHVDVPSGSLRHVLVKFLPAYFTKELLYTLFARFGPIIRCKLIEDKHNRENSTLGLYGFIEFADNESAQKSIETLNGLFIQGSTKALKVTIAQPAAHKTQSQKFDPEKLHLWIGNLPSEITADDLCQLFSEYGPIIESKIVPNKFVDDLGNPRAVGFVRYADPSHAELAISQMNGAQLRDSHTGAEFKLHVKWAHETRNPIQKARIAQKLQEVRMLLGQGALHEPSVSMSTSSISSSSSSPRSMSLSLSSSSTNQYEVEPGSSQDDQLKVNPTNQTSSSSKSTLLNGQIPVSVLSMNSLMFPSPQLQQHLQFQLPTNFYQQQQQGQQQEQQQQAQPQQQPQQATFQTYNNFLVFQQQQTQPAKF